MFPYYRPVKRPAYDELYHSYIHISIQLSVEHGNLAVRIVSCVEVQPAHPILQPYIMRKHVSLVADNPPRLFCGHAGDREVTSLALNVCREIRHLLLLHELAHVAPEPALGQSVAVAVHRLAENVPAYDQQAVQKVRIKEVPSLLPEPLDDVLAHQLVNVKVRLNRRKNLLSCHHFGLFLYVFLHA